MTMRFPMCLLLAVLVLAGNVTVAAEPDTQQDPAASTPDYLIGPGDRLNIFVWNHADLSVTVPVRPDGKITTPLVEQVLAAGKTPIGLARDLEAALSEYVRSPKVNVIVTEFAASLNQVRVVGRVERPQAIPYRAGMTVLDVVIAVGGLSPFAAGNRAKIVRGTAPNLKELPVRLSDLMNKGRMKFNVPMQPGDVLIIPESRF